MSKTAPIKPFNGKPTSSLQGTDISPAQAYKMTNYNESDCGEHCEMEEA